MLSRHNKRKQKQEFFISNHAIGTEKWKKYNKKYRKI